jgi:deoxyribodipyrimidine photo-lyase
MTMAAVPASRLRDLNQRPIDPKGDYVLYWMTAYRRTSYNFSLDRALERARELNRPLVILEALRLDYPWASRRLHAFVLEGMADNLRRLARTRVFYYPFIDTRPKAGQGLLAALSQRACLVVTDEFPCFFIPAMQRAAASQVPVKMEAVDSCGLIPLSAADRVFPTAYAWRRYMQKVLPGLLLELPSANPFKGKKLPGRPGLPREIIDKWPPATEALLSAGPGFLSGLPLDQSVDVAPIKGGPTAARNALRRFLREGLGRYLSSGRQPLARATSGLSPYLHFGHISSHQVLVELAADQDWDPDRLALTGRGQRSGWWGMIPEAEAFLDQLITWRELGFNMCWHRPDYDRYESLPPWALKTLEKHQADPRPYVYDLDRFQRADTHDRLWNAAQGQLVAEGFVGNYLRMLWGKKILEWSASPQEALEVMIQLNNRFALDGRDPNSVSGIFWCLGRYDRPWGPERPVFGQVRYMSSKNTARKIRVTEYIEKYAPESA